MELDARQRQRFARHLLLPELGKQGQAELCASSVRAPEGPAGAVASDYLTRAGVQCGDEGAAVPVADGQVLAQLAGDPSLEHAAAALAGAFAAVEAIKGITGAGEAGALPPELTLAVGEEP